MRNAITNGLGSKRYEREEGENTGQKTGRIPSDVFASVVTDFSVLFADAFALHGVKLAHYSTHPRKSSVENRGVMPASASGPATKPGNYETRGDPDTL